MKLTPRLFYVGMMVGCTPWVTATTAEPQTSGFPTEPLAFDKTALRQQVRTSYANAREYIRNGASAEALRELLWCFDEGMPQLPDYTEVRRSSLLSTLRILSASYTPAWQALVARYDAVTRKMQSREITPAIVQDFAALERAVGVERKGLGAPEANWHPGETIYSERGVTAYRAAGRYYYFQRDTLLKVDAGRISSRAINQLDPRKVLRELFAAPPLGTKEAYWLSLSGVLPYPVLVNSSAGNSIQVYQAAGFYYHFHDGILVKRSPQLSPPEEIEQIDPRPIRGDYFALSPLGMSQQEWLHPLIAREGAISAYRGDSGFFYFKNGLLVKTDPSLNPLKYVAALDETPIFSDNFRPLPKKKPKPQPKPVSRMASFSDPLPGGYGKISEFGEAYDREVGELKSRNPK